MTRGGQDGAACRCEAFEIAQADRRPKIASLSRNEGDASAALEAGAGCGTAALSVHCVAGRRSGTKGAGGLRHGAKDKLSS